MALARWSPSTSDSKAWLLAVNRKALARICAGSPPTSVLKGQQALHPTVAQHQISTSQSTSIEKAPARNS
eukprot:Skav229730  [mRNA]  locus=scaffold1287:42321:42530:- [translate_table: standard]